MSENTDQHPAGGNETQTSRTASESGDGGVSRRDALRGTAASFVPASGIVGGFDLGLNSKGVPVVVVQTTPNSPVAFQRRRNITDRVHDEAIDRGREPPREKTGVGVKGERATGNGEPAEKETTGEIVAYVSTITDDGIPRKYYGHAENTVTTGSVHGSAMARAKKLAEENGSEIEVHKPDGTTGTINPNDVGKANRASDISGATTGFKESLIGSTYATLDDAYERFAVDLDASLSMTADYEDELDFVDDFYVEQPTDSKQLGYKEVKCEIYHNYTNAKEPYALGGWFFQKSGEDKYGSQWENNYGKYKHQWPAGLPVEQMTDWIPAGDQGQLESTSRSVTVGADGISFGKEEAVYRDGVKIDDRSSPENEKAYWYFPYNTRDTQTGQAQVEFASVARQDPLKCDGSEERIMDIWHEAGFKERGESCGFNCTPRDSIYWDGYVWMSC